MLLTGEKYVKAPVNRAELKISSVLAILNNKHVQALYLKGSRNVFLVKAFDSSVFILHILRVPDCHFRESLAKLEESKLLIICLKFTFGELSSKILFECSGNL